MFYCQNIKNTIKQILPALFLNSYRRYYKKNKILKRYPLSDLQLEEILIDKFNIKKGDIIFLHSSLNQIEPVNGVMSLLQTILKVIGKNEGTLVAPSYPKYISREFMQNNEMFDVNNSPSYSGMISELLRRMPGAKRSLHPTKSVVALGKYSEELIKHHGESLFPYDENSPYYKIMKYDGKIMGVGVNAEFLSFYHVIEDVLKKDFPVDVYGEEIFTKFCIDSSNNNKTISTYCHYMPRVGTKTIKRVKTYLDDKYFFDGTIYNIPFFYVESVPFYNRMIELATQGITVYSKKVYKVSL